MRPAEATVPDLVPIEKLDQDILNLAARINMATCELVILIREFDERAGFLKWGFENCAEWLAWRCDYSMATAREKVRVARALKDLPVMTRAFAAGELSWSKVRELTRVATTSNEDALVDFALVHSSSHVAGRCRELRMGDASSVATAERAFDRRSLRVHRDAERGMISITVDLPLDAGQLIDKALDRARDDACLKIPDLVDASWSRRQADAFVTMVKEYLAGDARDNKNADNYLVNIHVDQSALAGRDGRASLPIDSVKRLCCDGPAVVVTEDKGEPLSIGRKTRIVPRAIERAVRARDHNQCIFPGCRNQRFLNCHHVEHWANGGETSLDNLVLLCTRHHTLVHEGGFRVEKDFTDSWYFVRPDGVAVPDVGYHRQDMIDDELDDYVNPPRGGLLSALEKVVSEPPSPGYLQ